MLENLVITLDLAQRSKELFFNGNSLQKQKLLKFALSNVYLYDKKLSYTVNEPFKAIIKQNKNPQNGSSKTSWCYSVRYISNAIQTAAQQLHDDYTLKDLAEEFQLNGELLASVV